MRDVTRIAMWSGPRNISTAMMRAWGARPDTFVCDEPFYAHYLHKTGLRHPGFEAVLAAHEADVDRVIAGLVGPAPAGQAIFYQKHMAHHLVGDVPMGWLDEVVSCFLIRNPREMLTSIAKVIPDVTLEQTGLPQQVGLFELVRSRTGRVPPVLDARDVLTDPGAVLARLCEAMGVEYTDTMLRWAPGRRTTDGAWAPHWYAAVEASTGFAKYHPKRETVPAHLTDLANRCDELYHKLHHHRLT